MTSTLSEYLQSQEELMREAALALPHSFSQCTYSLGPLRQAVYLCLTCPEARGLCSACSVACHTNHEQVELFPKRDFRCDCPTSAITHSCTLHTKLEPENSSNQYGQNFKNTFCRCGRPYDAKTEIETMIQCLACEDWFHESCCNLRGRPSSRESSPTPEHTNSAQLAENVAEVDDNASEASSGLPPPLITGDEYESFICSACVLQSRILKKWAGTFGAIMVVRDTPADSWRRLNGVSMETEGPINIEDLQLPSGSGIKRPLSPSGLTEPDPKRARGGSQSPHLRGPCLVPSQPTLARETLAKVDQQDPDTALGSGDIFLTEGFRGRWCHCAPCQAALEAESYLLRDEETYEPPEDPDSGLSLEELGMRALQNYPRDRAIDGIHAFNEMKDNLVQFLRPFAQEGMVVNETDVREFFASLNESAKQGRK